MNIHDYSIDVSSRTIYFFGDVTLRSSAKFIKNLDLLRGPRPITIKLATGGGDEHAGLAMYQAMRGKGVKVTVIASGEIASMGVLLLQGGDRRIVSPTTLMAYHVGTVEMGELAPEEASRQLDSHRQIGDLIDDIIYARIKKVSGLTRTRFDAEVKESFFLVGQDVVDAGYADEVRG